MEHKLIKGKEHLDKLYRELAADPYKVDKYGHAGIYSISITSPLEKHLVYIGKSKNMLYRLASHMEEIGQESANKYKVLNEAIRRGYSVDFDVLYDCPFGYNEPEQEDDLGLHEGMLIRFYMPPLNTQIPKAGDWRHYHCNKQAKSVTLDDILTEVPPLETVIDLA